MFLGNRSVSGLYLNRYRSSAYISTVSIYSVTYKKERNGIPVLNLARQARPYDQFEMIILT